MNSTIVAGKVLDWKFKQSKNFSSRYNFYIGDILIGQLFRMGKMKWTAVSWKSAPMGLVDGFRSRYCAAEYLLRLNGYQR